MLAEKKKKKVTITTIAKALGVSIGTVSFVLSGQSKERGISEKTSKLVHETARKMGYIPNYWARSLQRKSTRTVSVLFDGLGGNWAEDIVEGIFDVLGPKGYVPDIMVHDKLPLLDERVDKIRRREILSILEMRKEGVLCQAKESAKDDYKALVDAGIPLVFVSSILDDMSGLESVSTVTWDCGPAVKSLVDHLAEIGKKKIGFVGWHHGVRSDGVRFEAFKEALNDNGLEYNEEFIFWSDMGDESVFDRLKEVVCSKGNRPDALFVLNDGIAMLALDKLFEWDIEVGNEIAVTGMGDLVPTRWKSVGLTSAHEPLAEIGAEAAKVVIELIENHNSGPIHQKISCNDIKIRRTTVGQ